MPRTRERACLEDGLRLDLNQLVRDGCWPRGNEALVAGVTWTLKHLGLVACARLTIQIEEENQGHLKIELIGRFEQRLDLIAQPRHFGGRQWYFLCPVTSRKCSVVWLPPGADRFCSRQAWGKQVAYSTQFLTPFDRALTAQHKIKSQLIGDLDPRHWDLPPKRKYMRWKTYERLEAKFMQKQDIIDQIIADYVR